MFSDAFLALFFVFVVELVLAVAPTALPSLPPRILLPHIVVGAVIVVAVAAAAVVAVVLSCCCCCCCD